MFQEFSMKLVLLSDLSTTLCWSVSHFQWILLQKWTWFWPYDLGFVPKRTDYQKIFISLQWC